MRFRVLALVGIVAPLAALGACGGSGSSGDDADAMTVAPAETRQAPPTTEAAPEPEPAPAPEPEPTPEPEPAPEPLPGLPAYTAGFQSWDRINKDPIPPNSPATQRVGFDAHTSTKNVRVNRDRNRLAAQGRGTRRPYPNGTILVKEGRTSGFISLVAIMRKIQGVDPEHGNWEFVEYKRSGPNEPFATEPRLMGQLCWQCHTIARETDWVFTPNDG